MNTEENMEVSEIATETISEDETLETEFIQRCRRDKILYRRRIYEFEREKEINAEIEKMVKKFLKFNRQFRRVKTREEESAMLVFLRSNLSHYSLICRDKFESDLINLPEDSALTRIYIKNTNPHDRSNSTMGFIKRKMTPAKKFYI